MHAFYCRCAALFARGGEGGRGESDCPCSCNMQQCLRRWIYCLFDLHCVPPKQLTVELQRRREEGWRHRTQDEKEEIEEECEDTLSHFSHTFPVGAVCHLIGDKSNNLPSKCFPTTTTTKGKSRKTKTEANEKWNFLAQIKITNLQNKQKQQQQHQQQQQVWVTVVDLSLLIIKSQ